MNPFKPLLDDPNRLVIYGATTQLNSRELQTYIAGFQSQLLEKNTKTCAIYSHDPSEFIAGLLACYFLGIDVSLPPNNSVEMIESIRMQACIGQLDQALIWQATDHDLVVINSASQINIYTSGSTGKPKKIARSMAQLLLEADELNRLWPVLSNTPPIFASTVSYQHIYGLLFAVLWPLKQGIKIWESILPFEESLLNLSHQHPHLSLISSPAFLKRLTNLKYHRRCQMTVFSSGGFLNPEHHQNTNSQLNCSAIQVYGSSETGGIAHKTIGTEWQFFPSARHLLVDKELYIKSPFCYTDKWQNTQDLVRFNAKGFQLLGRSDRIVKIEEKRVSLIQVENALLQSKLIKNVHIIHVSDKRQYLAAIIVLNDNQELKHRSQAQQISIKKQIKSFIRNKVEPLAMPRKIRFVSQIPMNGQGKFLHQEMLDLIKDNPLNP